MARLSTFSFQPSIVTGPSAATGHASARSGSPDWAILFKAARVSDHRNATTAGCDVTDDRGQDQRVEVSFWLADPPGISYFSLHCPGLNSKVYKALLLCAEANFVLVAVTFRGSTHHLVYTAGKKQSLRPLPRPDPAVFRGRQLGLLPRGDGEHYAVAFVDRTWTLEDDLWRFDAHVFSSETQTWRCVEASVSDSDKLPCARHVFTRPIAVGSSALGWANSPRGILLLCNLVDGRPAIEFITFPVPNVGFADRDGHYGASEYFCDVACCFCDDDLIKFVEIKHDDDDFLTGGKGWKATVWVRNVSCSNEWAERSTVHVDEISVHQSYSDLLPVLRDYEAQQLQLKKLIFYAPILSAHDDDLLYMMAKVNGSKDNDAWVVAIDMKRRALQALAPFSVEWDGYLLTMYRTCVFPKYINVNPGADLALDESQSDRSTYVETCENKPIHTKNKSSKWQQRKSKPSNSPGEKDEHNNGWVQRVGALLPGSWFMCFIGCLLILVTIVVSSPLNVKQSLP